MKRICAILLFLLLLLTGRSFAQQVTTIIQNATIHKGNGEVIEKGVLVMSNGKIEYVGNNLTSLYKNARVIDATGKHVYPGLTGMNTFVGLNEIDAVRATRDYAETGHINPNARALIAYNTDSKILPTLLANGILFTQVVPVGGLISGTSSLMKVQGWNWEDAAYKADEGIHLNWPELTYGSLNEDHHKQRVQNQLREIENLFDEAAHYRTISAETGNPRLEAMRALFDGRKKLYVHVNGAKSIAHVIHFFARKHPAVKLVLVGANDAWQLTSLIKQYDIPVVLNYTHRLPSRSMEDIDMPYRLPAVLTKAGITVAIGLSGSWEARNIMFNAGTAAAYGLTKEEALMLVTLNPAKIMGMDAQSGTLEAGKDANVLISSGDVLDMRGNLIQQAFIQGNELDLFNPQLALAKKFMKKYGLE